MPISSVLGMSPHCTPTEGALTMSTCLRREADSFVFRRRVPPHLQYRLRRKELYRSLNTTVRKTAKVRAAELFIQTEGLFRMLEEDEEYVPTDEDIRAAVRWSLNTEIWQERIKQLQSRTPGSLREHHADLARSLLVTLETDRHFTEEAVMYMEAPIRIRRRGLYWKRQSPREDRRCDAANATRICRQAYAGGFPA